MGFFFFPIDQLVSFEKSIINISLTVWILGAKMVEECWEPHLSIYRFLLKIHIFSFIYLFPAPGVSSAIYLLFSKLCLKHISFLHLGFTGAGEGAVGAVTGSLG